MGLQALLGFGVYSQAVRVLKLHFKQLTTHKRSLLPTVNIQCAILHVLFDKMVKCEELAIDPVKVDVGHDIVPVCHIGSTNDSALMLSQNDKYFCMYI